MVYHVFLARSDRSHSRNTINVDRIEPVWSSVMWSVPSMLCHPGQHLDTTAIVHVKEKSQMVQESFRLKTFACILSRPDRGDRGAYSHPHAVSFCLVPNQGASPGSGLAQAMDLVN
jgi:hypothetical protein